MTTYFITGTNRGIGLELVRQLSRRADVGRIYATSRGASVSAELQALLNDDAAHSNGSKIVRLECDVSQPASLESALALVREDLKDGGVDVLINNVGTQSALVPHMADLPDETLTHLFDVNVLTTHRVSRALLPLLRKGKAKTIVNLHVTLSSSLLSPRIATLEKGLMLGRTTTLGSIASAPTFAVVPTPAYKVTKAALNMLTVQYALELGKEGFTVLAVSPGNIKTELGGGDGADLTPEVGVKATLDVILNAKPEQNGKFLNIHVPGWEGAGTMNRYDGGEVPW